MIKEEDDYVLPIFRLAVQFRLTWVRDQCIPLLQNCTMDYALRNGHLDVLNWWKENEIQERVWTVSAMISASGNGHVDVLDWWKDSGRVRKQKKIDA